jgi:hypothetical protein
MITAYLGIAIVLTILVLIYFYSGVTFNIYLVIYIIGAISVLAGGTVTSVNSGKTLAAVLFCMGGLAIFVIFGLKWFSPGSVFAKTPVPWPPTINTCPDYLVYYGRNINGVKENSCIDLIGVSKNGGLKVFPKEALNDTTKVPTDGNYYFSLKTDSSDINAKNKELCTRAITSGLTWEGITNGESCTTLSGDGVAPDGTTIPAGCPKL